MTTTAADVHLFAWIGENWAFILPITVMAFGASVAWFKVIVSRYPTRAEVHRTMDDKIKISEGKCEKQFADLEIKQRDIVEAITTLRHELLTRVDKTKDEVIGRVESIDKDNKADHSDIRKYIQNQTSLILDHRK